MEVFELTQEPKACSYLPNTQAFYRYFYIKNCTIEFYSKLLERGWRRFGNYFFVPMCEKCSACVSIRQDCENFRFSKSQRRILNHSRIITLAIQRPTLSYAHLTLYKKYHQMMRAKKAWDYQEITVDLYYDTFMQGHQEYGYEFAYYIDGALVGVALVDILPNCISSVYCYYDHSYQKYSLGTYSILRQIEFAQTNQLKYFYPGQWIEGHHSMGYKDKFKPFERLINRPSLHEEPIWVRSEACI